MALREQVSRARKDLWNIKLPDCACEQEEPCNKCRDYFERWHHIKKLEGQILEAEYAEKSKEMEDAMDISQSECPLDDQN